jgi:hypothetical protein
MTSALIALLIPVAVIAQGGQTQSRAAKPTIETKTAGMQKLDGYFPLYWDEAAGQLWLEIPRFDTEVLFISGLSAGLGSNDIGLDRGQLMDSRIVEFERVGPKVLLVQPNYDFRARTTSAAEERAVRDAFARSVLWGFTVAAETGSRVLVDATDFLVRDPAGLAQRLRPGSYRFEASRSSIHMAGTLNFPKNTELEAELTFVSQPGGGGAPAPAFFEGVGSVAAAAEAASMRVHHSLVELPGSGYEPRAFDPRAGYFGFTFRDYAAPITESQTRRFISRHRLEKRDPGARVSDPVKPIVYYLDPGTPEPIRSALLEGARWWNQAFEAAGYRNAFQVELLPEGIHPLDIRYNVINWVHRSTRGWSYGSSVTDPRTGEIIKGVVALGSLRVRQDYMIAEGLLSPYRAGTETPPELSAWALARLRQLSAHEVGHTLGLGHNYYDSRAGRISVMDYPHPLITLKSDGTLDHSQVYENGIAEWDSVAIAYGYQDFANGVNEEQALQKILSDAWERDVRYMTNQDVDAHPRVDQWSNGTDAAAELNRMMEVRRNALSRFGENAIRRGSPLATMEEVLVPLYLHHRYQVEAAASVIGGVNYIYAVRGDGREAMRAVPGAEQRTALNALLATIKPAELRLPASVLRNLPPRPSGYGRTRELFPRYTGGTFDIITPAVVAADFVIGNILNAQRAARVVEQSALDATIPSLDLVIDAILNATFGAAAADEYEREIQRATERVAIEQLVELSSNATMPQVRAIARHKLQEKQTQLRRTETKATPAQAAHEALLAADIERALARPAAPYASPAAPDVPPGAPIGEPALEWIRKWGVWECVGAWGLGR